MILWKERSSMHWQRFKSRSFYLLRYLFCQFLWPISHNPLQVCETSASDPFPLRSHHRMNLDESRFDWKRIWCSYFSSKKFLTPRWTLSIDLVTYFMMDVRMTHTARLFVTCPKFSNVFIDITENGFVWTRSICHNLKHPTGSRRSYIFVTDCVVSIYWPISKRHHNVLVFSFQREGCLPMVDTQPPKTF